MNSTMAGYKCASFLADRVPLRVGTPLARFAGRASQFLLPERRRIVTRHQKRISGAQLSGARLRRAVGEVFASYAQYWFELFRLEGHAQDIADRFTIQGLENLEHVLEKGRGAIVAMPHSGAWDSAGAWLAGEGFPIAGVAEVLKPPELFDWFVDVRAKMGIEIVPADDHASGRLAKLLADNVVVALVCDRDLRRNGAEVTFFGERTTFPAGPAVLARRTGAQILPTACYLDPDGNMQVIIERPIELNPDTPLRDEIPRVMQQVANQFETFIRQAPQNWHVLQPLWPSDVS